MVGAWHGHGMASVNQTRPRRVNQMGKTHSKPLAARHGRGTAWVRNAMRDLTFNRSLECSKDASTVCVKEERVCVCSDSTAITWLHIRMLRLVD